MRGTFRVNALAIRRRFRQMEEVNAHAEICVAVPIVERPRWKDRLKESCSHGRGSITSSANFSGFFSRARSAAEGEEVALPPWRS